MREPLARKAMVASLAAALVLFVVTDFEIFNSTRALIGANSSRARLTASLEDLRGMFSALKDLEAAQRGYVITGRADFLEPLQSGIPTTGPSSRQSGCSASYR